MSSSWMPCKFRCKVCLALPCCIVLFDLTTLAFSWNRRDPQIQIPFVEALYDGGSFLQSVPKALSSDGIFLCQVGQAPAIKDAAEEDTVNRNRANFFRSLTRLGFQGTRDYEEVHCEDRYRPQVCLMFSSNTFVFFDLPLGTCRILCAVAVFCFFQVGC
jgi:hypothetical protein